MQTEIEILLLSAVTIACLHTISGPDHYLPFIALSKSRGWSCSRTLMWTVICGCGHVWSSILLGLGGAVIGWSLSKIEWLESVRGGIAGWALIAFGVAYTLYGSIKGRKSFRHKHFDTYEDGEMYVYEHKHGQTVMPLDRHKVTPWVMFVIFVLGPCEPMIPLLYFPAAKNSWWGMGLLIMTYTFFTLLMMILMVAVGYYGFSVFNTSKLEPYLPALSGITIFICGLGMVWMGW